MNRIPRTLPQKLRIVMKKLYTLDTHRVCDPKITVKVVMEKLQSSWVWEEENMSVYDIWKLDIFQEYVYCVSSHVWRRNNWWKWLTKYQALASALMEFAERYSWYKIIDGVNNTISRTHNQIHWPKINIDDLILTEWDIETYKNIDIYNELELKWIEWYSLTEATHKSIPWYEYEFLTTNCLWAGNTLEEAIIHAIYETVERHHYNVMMANLDVPRLIDISSITNKHIQNLISKIQSFGFEIYIMDCSFDFWLHTIWALIYNWSYQFVSHYAMNLHMGTHSNSDIAIIRALTEIVQNRATNLDNNKFNISMLSEKDYLDEMAISPITAYYLQLFRDHGAEIIRYSDLINTDVDNMTVELDNLVRLLEQKWFEVLVIDATQKNIDIACVRVVIPGLQPMIFELFDDALWKNVRRSQFLKNSK